MRKTKELWSGAGLWLDLGNIQDDADREKIERHLEGIKTTSEQIIWLDRFLIEFSDQRSRILERATQGVTLNRIHELEFVGPFRAQTERFADYVQRLKKKLQAVAEIERREASHKDYLAKQSRPAAQPDIGDEPTGKQWSNEQIMVALYALLRAAGLPDNYKKTAVDRFAALLSGRSQQKMKVVRGEVASDFPTFSDDRAKAVADQFEEMGLKKIAQAIRAKTFTTS